MMKILFAIFAATICFTPLVLSLSKNGHCQPVDEFPDEDGTTMEWDEFMDALTNETFNKNYSQPCINNPSETVVIDGSSQFIWDLRFAIYSERLGNGTETIAKCFTTSERKINKNETVCEVTELEACLKRARIEMLHDIDRFWEKKVNEELEKRRLEC